MIDAIHFIAAHLFIFSFCLAILVLDPIHETTQAQIYPRQQIKRAYNIRVPEMKG